MSTITETRAVKGIDEVLLCGYGDLVVEQTDGAGDEGSLIIEADESLMPKIASDVRGRRLLLRLRMPWYDWVTWVFSWAFIPNKAIRYRLRVSRIRELAITGSGRISCAVLHTDSCRLHITGSGRIDAEGVGAAVIEARISGSGDIHCAGAANRVHAEITGSGSVQAQRLAGRSVGVGISGSGGVVVSAAETLDVRITGSGGVRYSGSPKVSSKITGSGRVTHIST